jgi:hypothetical protein
MIQIIGCLTMALFSGSMFWVTVSLGSSSHDRKTS